MRLNYVTCPAIQSPGRSCASSSRYDEEDEATREAQLADDIKANGLLEPVILYKDRILDGRNRARACELAGVPLRFEVMVEDDDPLAFVLSKNLHRRHLTASQRAAIAAELLPDFEERAKERKVASAGQTNAKLGRGQNETVPAFLPEPSPNRDARDDAAKEMQVSPRYVSDAKRIKREDPEMFEKVKRGTMTIPKARRRARPVEDDAQAI